jgi:UDP-N-acetylmuramate dehydrogenase
VKDQYIITSVVFKLTKRDHKINTSYGDITNELAKKHYKSKFERRKQCCCHSTKQITDPKNWETVVAFKNQSLKTDFEKIQQFPEMKYYDVSETEVKVPAGWLIEQAGLRETLWRRWHS